jgi:hypothetical protein
LEWLSAKEVMYEFELFDGEALFQAIEKYNIPTYRHMDRYSLITLPVMWFEMQLLGSEAQFFNDMVTKLHFRSDDLQKLKVALSKETQTHTDPVKIVKDALPEVETLYSAVRMGLKDSATDLSDTDAVREETLSRYRSHQWEHLSRDCIEIDFTLTQSKEARDFKERVLQNILRQDGQGTVSAVKIRDMIAKAKTERID